MMKISQNLLIVLPGDVYPTELAAGTDLAEVVAPEHLEDVIQTARDCGVIEEEAAAAPKGRKKDAA
jgi:hypothetical protein